jgi:hypothetical protein
MAIDHTQLTDVPHRPAAGLFAAAHAGNVVIGDRLPALAELAKICLTSGAAPMRRGSTHRLGRR